MRSPRDIVSDLKLPVADGAEEALIASLLKDPSKMDLVAPQLGGGDFADADLGALFEALVSLHEAGRSIGDAHVLGRDLRGLGVPDTVGSVAALAKLISRGVPGHETYYVQQIRDAATLRRYQRTAIDLLSRIQAADAEPAEVRRWLDAQLQTADARQVAAVRSIGDIAGDVLRQIDSAATRPRGVMTGLYSYDFTAGPLMPGEITLIAARPNVGKTALGCQIAYHAAQKGKQVFFCTIEMTETELTSRMMCGIARVDSRDVRAGNISDDDRRKLAAAAKHIQDVPLTIWAPPKPSVREVKATTKLHAAKNRLDLVVVDYIGLLRPENPREPRHEQVRAISEALKAAAKELAVPILALAQLNREADGTRPTLAMLADSGALERDADQVVFLHSENGRDVELIVAKHRYGPKCVIRLEFIAKQTEFVDPAAPQRIAVFDEYNDGNAASGGTF